MAEKKDQANTGLNQLETEQLEELLCVSLDNQEDSDTDRILDLLQMIEERKNQSESVPDLNIDKAWETFQSVYAAEDVLYPIETADPAIEKQPRRKRLSLRRVLIGVAVAACLLALAIPTAVGTKIFQQMVGTWTEEEFQFESQTEDVPTETEIQQSDTARNDDVVRKNNYTSLKQALNDYGITEKILPTYIPKEYTLSQVSVTELNLAKKVIFSAFYEADNDRTLSIIYKYNLRGNMGSTTYEKDEREVQSYTVNGITHYIFHNYDRVAATWFNKNIECSVHADCTVQEMKKIIDSIYKG